MHGLAHRPSLWFVCFGSAQIMSVHLISLQFVVPIFPFRQPNKDLKKLPTAGHACLGPATVLSSAEVVELLEEARGDAPQWAPIFNDQPPPISQSLGGRLPLAVWGDGFCEMLAIMGRAPDDGSRQAAYGLDQARF
jgi:hypothetical protein